MRGCCLAGPLRSFRDGFDGLPAGSRPLGTTPFASRRALTLLDMTPTAATAAFNSPELQPNFFIQYSTSSGSCTFTCDVCSGLKLDSSINAFRPANPSAKQCAANEEKQPSVNYSRPNQPYVHARVRCRVDLQRVGAEQDGTEYAPPSRQSCGDRNRMRHLVHA